MSHAYYNAIGLHSTLQLMTNEEAAAAWASNYATQRRYWKWQPTFYRALKAQKAPVIEVAKAQGAMAAYAAIPFTPTQPLQTAYRKFYAAVVPHEASREYARLSRVKAFGVNIDWLRDVLDFLDSYMLNNIIVPMTERTKQRMLDTLNDGLANGDSNDEIIRALEDPIADTHRARLIVRTEATRATNFGAQLGADKHDFKTVKVWLAARDWRTRGGRPEDQADHLHMHLERADEYGVFTDPRNGARLLFPGDSTQGAGAGDLCNCRCSVRNEAVRDADGRLVLK